jgi:hypothetical protein
MRPELVRKAMAKMDSMFAQAVDPLTAENTDLNKRRRTIVKKGLWTNSPQRIEWQRRIRKVPDKQFEELMSSLDGISPQIHKSYKDAAANAPKNRGGRTPHFKLAVRQQAIQDFGQELARSRFSEAIEIVAKRHGMEKGYLRRVWKNRKRLMRT